MQAALAVGALLCLSYFNAEKRTEDFLAWPGERICHTFKDVSDKSSDQQILELQDERGMPLWFGRYFYKDVCVSGKCQMICLWIFWDGAGNYLGIQVLEDEPLTKSDHTVFAPQDYRKLDEILSDRSSVLGNLKQEDLVVIPDSIDNPYELDGYTAATQPALSELIVKDAVYTCYTLWHTVYGSTRHEIIRLLDERTDVDFLKKMLASRQPGKIIWAIEAVEKHPKYHEAFYPRFIELMKWDDELVAGRALDYFRHNKLDNDSVQNRLVEAMPFLSARTNVELIWQLVEQGTVSEETFGKLIQFVADGKLKVTALNLVYQLFQADFLKNEQIKTTINSFLNGEDAYVRRLTKNLVDSH